MRDELNRLDEEMEKALGNLDSLTALEALRVMMLGKKGQLTAMMRMMGQLSAEERPQMGQLINERRERFTRMLDERQQAMQKKERELRLQMERLDVTEPKPLPEIGSVHPNTLVLNEVVDCFTGMGFEVVEGPEVELDHFNFELLNIPKNHPARDAQDTFYIDDNVVLRTHTSPVQARTMTTRKPPIRIICPGRVYRADEVDATHSPVFHQIEGLVIDEGVSMGDLKATLAAFARRLYGSDIHVRFRPSFFPFTEPSAEADLTCVSCRGKGCRICKGTGWIEVLGCGMVNPHVLEMCGIDPKRYSGFAFGIGLERITMLRYGIKDMRLMYEGDLRFLRQFREDVKEG
ncbi:MAG: phenylalanine--tRNA ligase subunit alpha [Clostridia bacterium]|nr:phenylalanine--tRNA ligase subunit alpha [Clostridia bacterium]